MSTTNQDTNYETMQKGITSSIISRNDRRRKNVYDVDKVLDGLTPLVKNLIDEKQDVIVASPFLLMGS